MTSNAGRKKSIASSGPNGGLPQIDIPGGVNTLNKKPGSSAVPLYQQCSQVRNRLLRIHDFSPYFSISQVNARQSTDPVHHLWDTLSLGTPLCFLYNLLPLAPASRIKDINADPEDIDPNNIKDKKKAIAAFILGILNLQRAGQWDEGEIFTVGDLLGAQGGERNTNGFVKVCSRHRLYSSLLSLLNYYLFL
jgi:cell division control protein 24